MKLKINYNECGETSIGYSLYEYFQNNKLEVVEMTFTKGKIELDTNTIERIKFYENSIKIAYKNGENHFINIMNITQVK